MEDKLCGIGAQRPSIASRANPRGNPFSIEYILNSAAAVSKRNQTQPQSNLRPTNHNSSQTTGQIIDQNERTLIEMERQQQLVAAAAAFAVATSSQQQNRNIGQLQASNNLNVLNHQLNTSQLDLVNNQQTPFTPQIGPLVQESPQPTDPSFLYFMAYMLIQQQQQQQQQLQQQQQQQCLHQQHQHQQRLHQQQRLQQQQQIQQHSQQHHHHQRPPQQRQQLPTNQSSILANRQPIDLGTSATLAPTERHSDSNSLYSKPAHSYIGLIGMCILSSPEKRMVLNDIYQFILDNYPYYRNRGSGWRNSVRHNLSLNECFQKAGRAANGKGHYWTIHPANMEDFMVGDFRRRRAQRKVRRWNNMDVPSDESGDESMEDATKPPLPEHFKRSLEMHRRIELSYQKAAQQVERQAANNAAAFAIQ